jgi:ribosomal protein S18 acetylase RimI-like enzyme
MRTIREIELTDIPSLFQVRTATDENRLSMEQLAALAITPETVKEKLLGSFKGWLCEDEGRVVGFVMGDRSTGEMWVIAVLPGHIRQGIGSQLLARVENWLFSMGCAEIWLVTGLRTELRAYSFYRKHGWEDWKIEYKTRYMKKMRNGALLIQFRDNQCGHDDVHVWIEGYYRTTDSYYFALDQAMLAGKESADKVRRVLIRLLDRWMEALAQATPAQMVYLPFDFSDEYTGCFQCRPDGAFVEVTPGWSNRMGWSFAPSDPGDYFFGITDFKSDAPAPIRLPKEEFTRRIRESIADTESQLLATREERRR